MTIQRGDYILWKPYGFCHIARDDKSTFCGNIFGWMIERDKIWAKTGYVTLIKTGDQAQKRPICGTCRKLNERQRPS